ncbi:MAG: hypothetical protein LBM68_06850 [Bacteroidales bacterium]|jgi:hypothetical protein|nr:hypothetical protein [Bacteroidales bacterium]
MIETNSNIALITKEECFEFFDAVGQPELKNTWEKRESVICKALHDFAKGDSASWIGAIGNLPYRAVVILNGADISTSGQKVDFKARPLRVAFDTPVLPKEYANLQVGSRIAALNGLTCEHIVLKSYGDNRYRLFNTKGLSVDGKELTIKYDCASSGANYTDQYEQDSETAWSNQPEIEEAMREFDALVAQTGYEIAPKKGKSKPEQVSNQVNTDEILTKIAEAKELVFEKLQANPGVLSYELAHELVEKFPYELYFADAVELAKDMCEVKRINDGINDMSEVKNASDWNTISALLERTKEQNQRATTIEINAANHFSQR